MKRWRAGRAAVGVACAAALALASPAQADLDWQRQAVSIEAEPGQEQVEAHFGFTNTGEDPITLTKITSSCGCTTAKLDKKTYAPGESGQITARFVVGNNVGTQRKRIVVRSDEETASATTLSLTVEVPELLRLSSPYVHWRASEALEAKTLTVQVMHEAVQELGPIQSDQPAVAQAELERLEEEADRRYHLHIQPTGATGRARLSLPVTLAGERTKTFTATARILPRPDAQPVEEPEAKEVEPLEDPEKATAPGQEAARPEDSTPTMAALGVALDAALERALK